MCLPVKYEAALLGLTSGSQQPLSMMNVIALVEADVKDLEVRLQYLQLMLIHDWLATLSQPAVECRLLCLHLVPHVDLIFDFANAVHVAQNFHADGLLKVRKLVRPLITHEVVHIVRHSYKLGRATLELLYVHLPHEVPQRQRYRHQVSRLHLRLILI